MPRKSGYRGPVALDMYLQGMTIRRALRRYDANIFKIIRYLNIVKQRRTIPRVAIRGLRRLMFYLYPVSPWMWGHECLYRSLLYYVYSTEKINVNLGLTIRYHNKNKLGHCWVSLHTDVLDERDRAQALYYSKLLSQRGNVYYWLPAESSGNALAEVMAVKLPIPKPMKLKEGDESGNKPGKQSVPAS